MQFRYFGFSLFLHGLLVWAVWSSSAGVLGTRTFEIHWLSTSAAAPPIAGARLAPIRRPPLQRQSDSQNRSRSTEPSIWENSPAIENAESSNSATQNPVEASAIGLSIAYPRLSRILGEEGRVVARVVNGRPFVVVSSGFDRLDQSVLDSITQAIESKNFGGLDRQDIGVQFKLAPNAAPGF